jgi:hypothetical protein
MLRKFWGIISVYFDVTGLILITYTAFVKYVRKNGNAMKQFISDL